MKTYKPNKALKISMIILGIFPLLIGLSLVFMSTLSSQISEILGFLIAGVIVLFLFILIINKSFTNIKIQGNNIILKSPFFPEKIYDIKQLKEMAMFDYQNIKPDNNTIGITSEARIGRGIGLGLLAYAKKAPKNCTFEQQFMAKYGDNKMFSIVTNFIDDSNQLVAEIKAIAGVDYIHVTLSTYKEWRLKK